MGACPHRRRLLLQRRPASKRSVNRAGDPLAGGDPGDASTTWRGGAGIRAARGIWIPHRDAASCVVKSRGDGAGDALQGLGDGRRVEHKLRVLGDLQADRARTAQSVRPSAQRRQAAAAQHKREGRLRGARRTGRRTGRRTFQSRQHRSRPQEMILSLRHPAIASTAPAARAAQRVELGAPRRGGGCGVAAEGFGAQAHLRMSGRKACPRRPYLRGSRSSRSGHPSRKTGSASLQGFGRVFRVFLRLRTGGRMDGLARGGPRPGRRAAKTGLGLREARVSAREPARAVSEGQAVDCAAVPREGLRGCRGFRV